MAYAPVNGLQLYYETHGSGRPLVLLHGWPDDHRPQLRAVARTPCGDISVRVTARPSEDRVLMRVAFLEFAYRKVGRTTADPPARTCARSRFGYPLINGHCRLRPRLGLMSLDDNRLANSGTSHRRNIISDVRASVCLFQVWQQPFLIFSECRRE
jgi:hypothetical protein